MACLILVKYIDTTVVLLYLPVFLLSSMGLVLRKRVFGWVFFCMVLGGLIAEYLISISQTEPTMKGAFLSLFFIVAGFAIGVILQVFSGKLKYKAN